MRRHCGEARAFRSAGLNNMVMKDLVLQQDDGIALDCD